MNIKEILADPGTHFETPKDVLNDDKLSKDEKITILESWIYDIEELNRAEEENMPGDDNTLLLQTLHEVLLQVK